jgi:hypothetical protein
MTQAQAVPLVLLVVLAVVELLRVAVEVQAHLAKDMLAVLHLVVEAVEAVEPVL